MTKPQHKQKYPLYDSTTAWLETLASRAPDLPKAALEQSCQFVESFEPIKIPYASSAMNQGLIMADALLELNCDTNTLAAAIAYPTVYYHHPKPEALREALGNTVYKLLTGALRLEAIHDLHKKSHNHDYIDNVRKMLLAMVDDIRVVLIKLAERVSMLKYLRHCTPEEQHHVACDTMDLYAPLANRLGIGQIKWQLEDLAFRYLEPERYAEISKSLKMRRDEREAFIASMIEHLNTLFHAAHIDNISITGRAKHIYSIHRKSVRKNVPIEEIYDTSALRVLVPTVYDCYTALSIVHAQWEHIPKEFDDYIAKPKPNGYQSIHTAVIGSNNINVEIQIRTFQMHEDAELGVAAHWKYKEGGPTGTSYEDKIAWLREVMDWQKEITSDDVSDDSLYHKIFQDRIYVFTPRGDVFDLPAGATALDFAYHVHTDVGHRCKGAKINGAMTPLTHTLRTGDQVEILTAKNHTPSRDWLNPASGYLKTNTARNKVRHWFRKTFYRDHLAAGHDIWDKATRKLQLKKSDYPKLIQRFNFKNLDDLIAAIGAGDLSIASVLHQIRLLTEPQETPESAPTLQAKQSREHPEATDISIQGVGDVLTTLARCCKPIPGDPIIGFITKGRGISIHQQNCNNLAHAKENKPERIIPVHWGEKATHTYPVDLVLDAFDRPGLVRDISALLANENIALLGLSTHIQQSEEVGRVNMTIATSSLDPLNKLLSQLRQIEGVVRAQRR